MKNVFFLIAVLFLSACDSIQIPFLSDSGTQIGGKGVQFAFIEYPQGDLIEGEQFMVQLKVTNYGESPVNGFICLQDTLADSLGGIPANSCQDFSVQGAQRSDKKILQEEQLITFGPFSYHNLQPEFTQTPNIHLSARYSVDSVAQFPICIKQGSLTQEKGLQLDCPTSGSVSGIQQQDFPLQVTNVERHISSLTNDQTKVSLQMTIKQQEEGRVIDDTSPLATTLTQEQLVDVSVGIYGVTELTCSPLVSGKIKMDKSEKVIKCSTLIGISQPYITSPVQVKLRYNFEKAMPLPGTVNVKKEVI